VHNRATTLPDNHQAIINHVPGAMRNDGIHETFTSGLQQSGWGICKMKEKRMRKTLIALSAAGTIALAGAASAQDRYHDQGNAAKLGAGAVVGTGVGLGLYHG